MMPRTRTASTRVRRVRRFGPPLLLLALCAVAPIPIASFAGGGGEGGLRSRQRRRFSSATKSSSSSSSGDEQEKEEEEVEVVARSAKELAADASSAEFGREVRYSSDLKALLPTRKMRFMKLDKFGRRIQRMEDDGTVNMMKEPSTDSRHTPLPTPPSAALAALAALGEDATAGNEKTKEDGSMPQQQQQQEPVAVVSSPSLATLLGEREKRSESSGKMNGDAILDEGDKRSVDLKGLLPKQKMRFMKLDKFGRRVQRMEDDGTVNMMKEPSAAVRLEEAAAEEREPRSDEAQRDANDGSDDESAKQPKTTSNYGSLKDLLPTRRATWTKLDVKGASVADERRTNKSKPDVVDLGNDVVVSGNTERSSLKDLLPQKAMWTKLDFHGVSIVDERRMPNNNGGRTANNAANDGGAGGGYSNLKTLLPERTVTWKNARVLQGAGGGSTRNAGDDARGRREERRRAAREEVVASVAASSSAGTDDEDDDASQDDRDEVTGSSSRTYANLKDLLPERKMTWR